MSSPTRYHSFPNTHWSLVRRAGLSDPAARHEALATLLARYTPALHSYLLFTRRLNPHDAHDLLHAFITERLLSSELLAKADPARGRFRSLLLTSLNHFLISHHRATKRHTAEPLPEDSGPASPAPSPSAALEAAWARTLLANVLDTMRHQCTASGRADIWTVFDARILAEIEHREPLGYEPLAQALGLTSPTQAANLLITAKRMFARTLRAAIAEYEPDESAIDAEIADLLRALAAAPSRSP